MTFLQPILLIALPLVALPILIHLINRQRHRTVVWGAMMFLLDAKRLTRGMARLRHWLIMAMRMLAIGALVFAVARPLASGTLGLTLGGAPDTTIILLDRSASMQEQNVQLGESKRAAALGKLAQLFQSVRRTGRVVLIDSGGNRATAIESPEALLQLPDTAATDGAADVPALLQTAYQYCAANQTGRTDIWICSDLRVSDWLPDDGRWAALREAFGPQEAVRFYLLSYPDIAPSNVSVTVEAVRLVTLDQTTQLLLDVTLRRPAGSGERLAVPLEFVINGARSVATIEMNELEYRLQGHSLTVDAQARSGWGYVELPADANLHDNRYYFAFGDAPERHTVIVTDDIRQAEPWRIAATAPVDPAIQYSAEVSSPAERNSPAWDKASLIVWQAPLPEGEVARQLQQYVEQGRPVVFFPPSPSSTESVSSSWNGFRWGVWTTRPDDEPLQVQSWRGDSDLLQHTLSGAPLPVGKLLVYQYCTLEGAGQPLATLAGGACLLQRCAMGRGACYFCTTLPGTGQSSLLRDGVVFYVMLHRALAIGAATQSDVDQWGAGTSEAREISDWPMLSPLPPDALSSDRALFAGVLQKGERLVALNRPASEDRLDVLTDQQVGQMFQGLSYRQMKEEIGSTSALASEVWRAFVVCMALALVTEAVLCLPPRQTEADR